MVTANQLLKEKCPDFHILDGFLGEKEANENPAPGGIGEHGMDNPIVQVDLTPLMDELDEDFTLSQRSLQEELDVRERSPGSVRNEPSIDNHTIDSDMDLDSDMAISPTRVIKRRTLQPIPVLTSQNKRRLSTTKGTDDSEVDDEDQKHKSKRVKEKENSKSRVQTRFKRKGGSEFDSTENFKRMMAGNVELRKEKLRIEELKVKARVAIRGGMTDEDREHQLKMQQLKLHHELEKQKMTLQLTLQIEEVKLRQIEARNKLSPSNYSSTNIPRHQISSIPNYDNHDDEIHWEAEE